MRALNSELIGGTRRPVMRRERWVARWSVVAAIAVHGVMFAVLIAVPARSRAPSAVPASVAEPDAIELISENEAPAAPEAKAPPEAPSPLSSLSPGPLAMAVRNETREHLTPAEPALPSPSPAEAETAQPFRGVTMGAPAGSAAARLGLELGAPNRFATGGGPPSPAEGERPTRDRPRTQAETKQAVEAALLEPARQRERELGLGPEGPVLAALGEGASSSATPVTGRAVFLAIADSTGMIIGIDVVSCDGARASWTRAAEIARTALKGKKLRLPSTAKRAEMRIEVTSAWKLPTGHDPGTDVSLFGLPVAKGEGKQSTKVSILDPIPKLRVVELAPDIKIPIVSVNIDIITVAGDPANIGAKPRRVIHTRLIDSKVL